MPEKKTNIVRKLIDEGNHKKALAIAKSFRLGITKDESAKMNRAYECIVHRSFYEQIGKDPDQEIMAGIVVLKKLYGTNLEGGYFNGCFESGNIYDKLPRNEIERYVK